MTEFMVSTKPRYRVQAGRSVGGLPAVVEKSAGYYLPVTGGWLPAEAGDPSILGPGRLPAGFLRRRSRARSPS